MPLRARPWIAPLAALLVLAACDKGSRPPDKMDPVTMDEAKKLAADFGAAMTPCDPDAAGALFDGENLIRRAVHQSKLPANLRRDITGSMDGRNLAGMLCEGMGEDASYVLLRIKEIDGQPRPLFRLIADDAVNYHELELGKSKKDQRVRIVDMRIYASGDLLSQSMTQLFDQAAAVMKGGADPAKLQRTIDGMKAARASGDAEEVSRLVNEMPPELRNTKPMRLAELMVGADLEEHKYAEIMERYRRDFPGDPSVDVISVDYFFVKKDRPRLLEAIAKLDALAGGDPYLAVMRANAHLLEPPAPDLAAAEQHARAAIAAEPSLELGHWVLAVVYLKRGDFAAVAPVVATLRTKFEYDVAPGQMEDEALWAPYFASEAYRQSLATP
jgi:hypothetical protein